MGVALTAARACSTTSTPAPGRTERSVKIRFHLRVPGCPSKYTVTDDG